MVHHGSGLLNAEQLILSKEQIAPRKGNLKAHTKKGLPSRAVEPGHMPTIRKDQEVQFQGL
jgi:hypothetical protein